MAKYFPSGERQTEDIGFLQGVCVCGKSGEGQQRWSVRMVAVVRVI